jgi:2-dehydro-3-deoxyglucarate aldolase
MNGLDLKRKLHGGQICIGGWITLADPVVAENLSHAGFDWLFVDTEHSPIPLDALQTQLLLAQRGGTPTLVRVPWNDPVMIKQVLDVGAEGILVPMVNSAEEARRAVEAAKYPPAGRRGWGPRAASGFGRQANEYAQEANDRIVVITQVEHIDAVRNLDSILAVPGLDGVFIGPSDLSYSMGIPRQFEHPDLIAAIQEVARKARAAGVPVGGSVDSTFEETMRWLDWGMQFVTVGTDSDFMMEAAGAMLRAVRAGADKHQSS